MKEGYDQNSEEINISVSDLVQDFTLKHQDNITEPMINDLFVILTETFGDGFIQGFNLGVDELEEKPKDQLEWWEYQDDDQAWIDDAATLTLEELDYYDNGSLEHWQGLLEEMDRLNLDDLPPGSPFDRGDKDGNE